MKFGGAKFTNSDFGAVLARNVRTLRVENDWSQDTLAEKTGLHRTYIGSIERNEQNISLDSMVLLAKALNAHPASLLLTNKIERYVKAEYGSVLGYNMFNFRSAVGYSQAVLAKKTGMNITFVGQVERNKENISLKNIVLIAKAFDVHPAALLLTTNPK